MAQNNITLRIPRRKGRGKTYAFVLLACAAGFAVVYSLLTGAFVSSPQAMGRVTAGEGSVDLLRGGEPRSLKAGTAEDLQNGDCISLSSGRAVVSLAGGDKLTLHGTGTLLFIEKAEGHLELDLDGVSLEGYFEKPHRVVNVDEDEHKHFVKDYELVTRSVVLVDAGDAARWKNLPRVWQLVRDKEKFLEYVREETRQFSEQD